MQHSNIITPEAVKELYAWESSRAPASADGLAVSTLQLNTDECGSVDPKSKDLCTYSSYDCGLHMDGDPVFVDSELTNVSVANAYDSLAAAQPGSGITFAALGLSQNSTTSDRLMAALVTLSVLVLGRLFVRKFLYASYADSASGKKVKADQRRRILHKMRTAVNWKSASLAKRKADEDKSGTFSNTSPKSKAQLDEELYMQMPSAKSLYSLLYDENEQRSTEYFDLRNNELNAKLVDDVISLLSQAIAHELRFFLMRTDMARGKKEIPSWMNVSELKPFADGSKLFCITELIQKKILPNLDRSITRSLVDKNLMRRALATVSSMSKQRTIGFRKIRSLYFQALPLYCVSLFLGITKTALDAYMFSAQIRLMDVVQVEGPSALMFLEQTIPFLIVRLVCEFIGIACRTLRCHAKNLFLRPLRSALFDSMMRQDIEYFDRNKSSDLNTKMQGDAEKLAQAFFEIPGEIIECGAGLCVAFYVVWSACEELLVAATLPPLCLGALHYGICKTMWKMWKRREGLQRMVSESSAELLRKIRTIREFGMEVDEADSRRAMDEYTVASATNINATETTVWHLNGLLWTAQHSFLLHEGSKLISDGTIKIGSLMAIEYQIGRISWSFRHILGRTPEFAKALIHTNTIAEMLASKSVIEGNAFAGSNRANSNTPFSVTNRASRSCETGKVGKNELLRPEQFIGKIEFKGVHFSYPKEPRKKILHGVSFTTDPLGKDPRNKGRRIRSIAFVGETGCGKSTSLSIIKRFYNPTAGTVLLDGKPITHYDPRHLRRNMAIVAQKTTLLRRTIRENIVYGLQPTPPESEVISCCKQASIWEDIREMPDQLDTMCGDDNLSGGQEQRIAIARALIRKPSILLLDEATSALDAKNERIVQRAIDQMMQERGRGCSITVAHRLTTIRRCDMIYVMHRGKIVEAGTHSDLLKMITTKTKKGKTKSGFYRELWETQQGDES